MKEHDHIGDYLQEMLERTPVTPLPRRRVSIIRVTALALALALVAGAVLLVVDRTRRASGQPPESTTVIAGRIASPPAGVPRMGRLVLVTIGTTLVRNGTGREPEPGQALLAGDVLETGEGAYAGIELGTIHTLVLGPQSRLVLDVPAPPGVHLARGALAVQTAHDPQLVIHAPNARVTGEASVYTVEAHDDSIQRIAVVDGSAKVVRARDGRTFELPRAMAMDTHLWSPTPGIPDSAIVGRLDALTPPGDDEPPVAMLPPPPHRHDDLVARIRKALANDDVSLAVGLVETEGSGRKDAPFLLAAADAYKQASQWTEAAGQYMAASAGAEGKEAERALLRAAQIHLKQLGDPARAAEIIDEYLIRFPEGAYLDEALYLAAIIQVRLGDHARARNLYEEYLDHYPDGVQAVRAHVALAKLYAFSLSDCPAAMAHASAIGPKSNGPAMEAELSKVESACTEKGQ